MRVINRNHKLVNVNKVKTRSIVRQLQPDNFLQATICRLRPAIFIRSKVMSYRNAPICAFVLALAIALAAAPIVLGQDNPDQAEIPLTPIYVSSRVFQLSAKKGSYKDLTDQVFRLRSAGLVDEEKWLNALKKVYPEFTPALLQTDTRRVFRTSRPGVLTFGQDSGRNLQVQLFGAQSAGDGVKPGTSLVTEVGLYFSNDRTSKPLTFAIQPLEVENGMTYFFASTGLRLSSKEYAGFIRKNASAAVFDNVDVFFVFAFSVELTTPVQSARLLNNPPRYSPKRKRKSRLKCLPH
jgi:hypothetical protein